MARTTTPNKDTKDGSVKAGNTGGGNRGVFLALAGFTALLIAGIAAFAIFSTVGTGGGSGAGNFTPNDKGLIPVGQKAPGFSARTADGENVTVPGDGASATMLVFFATWCPHCQNEAPVISELESQYDGLRVVMVGIDGEDNPRKVQDFADEYGIESPAVYQPRLGPEYRVSGYPTVYVLDEGGEVVGANAGEAPREVYEGWIEEARG